MDAELRTQVLVVGAGNAGLSAAVAARQRGAEVVVLEKAPKEHRGGNSALTVHMLFAYEGVEDVKPLVGDLPPDVMRRMEERVTRYTKAQYYDNIMRVTEGKSDAELATILVERSTDTVQWMRGLGHLWEPTFENPVSANVVSWEGGGHGMSTRWFDAFDRAGGTVLYDTQAVDLLQDDQGRVIGVRALGLNGFMNIYAGAVIMAAGSFESNAEMRARYLGPLWDTVKLRGTPFNTGEGLQMAMNIGALPNGSWSSCHASPQDAERPAFDYPGYNKTGDFWSRYSYPFSVMVNVYGKRFVDEGETWRGLTYAKMGRAILAQPRGAAFQLFDAKHRQLDVIRGYEKATGFSANTLEELAELLGILDIPTFMQTVRDYNDATQPGEFGAFRLDGLGAPGLEPPRSNWALPLDTPPYEGFPVVCGMTFCFGGLKTSTNCEVTHTMDRPIPGLYAVGEMLGGLWHWNYPSGGGMMAGAVFGRIAGTHAAASVVG
ncbi:MAG: FAD-dependent tricarballylate dehydrogenase TcuA [Chloroflexi bacterium]|nr:FAD-dependent tricarballylate dehydrogenase TcuA [Chloroflexota bacterium]